MSNNIKTLRQHLFDQLTRLSESDTREKLAIEAEKASSLVQITECILETVKVEGALLQQMKQSGSEFILIEKEEKKTSLASNFYNSNHKTVREMPENNEACSTVQYFEEQLLS